MRFIKRLHKGEREEFPANVNSEIVDNAVLMYGLKKIVFAAEGYKPNTLKRKPNSDDVPVSKHVYGEAIDLNVHWDKLGGPWSKEFDDLITGFGLKRPVLNECWHVELIKKYLFSVEKNESFFIFYLTVFF